MIRMLAEQVFGHLEDDLIMFVQDSLQSQKFDCLQILLIQDDISRCLRPAE